ncbi:hypothetical protein AD998_18900 [bacterium 336/3]|nr:hypothetical protein AD998_18900 [bacterium 336/3]
MWIEPVLRKFKDFDELSQNKNSTIYGYLNQDKIIPFDKLLELENIFIVGEPGVGKSRLMEEIKILKNATKVYDLKNGFNNIDIKDNTLLLDGLDEVNTLYFNEIINKLYHLKTENPSINFIISCRQHYIESELYAFQRFKDFSIVRIEPFGTKEIREYLQNTGIEENISASLINKTTKYFKNSILSIPRYLEIATNLIKEKKLSNVDNLTRVELFNLFINENLKKEKQKGNHKKIVLNDVVLVKRVLEKLALIMEIYQTNQIKKDELVDFLDAVESNINLIFLNNYDIDSFIERTLKSIGNDITFENTEFQECLAAQEFLRLGNKEQLLFDLIFDAKFKHIFPSWYNVLSFVIEIEPKIIFTILGYLKQKQDDRVFNDFYSFINQSSFYKFSSEDKAKIFESLYTYLQTTRHFVRVINDTKWIDFYQENNYCLFKEHEITQQNEMLIANQAYIMALLIENNKLNNAQKEKWKNYFIQGVRYFQSPAIEMQSLNALEAYKNLSLITLKDLKNSQRGTTDLYLVYCKGADPNNQKSIDLFLNYILKKNRRAKDGLNMVSSSKGVEYLINQFIKNIEYLEKYIETDNYTYTEIHFWYNLDVNWSDNIKNKIYQLLELMLKRVILYETKFEKNILKLLKVLNTHNEDFILDYLQILEEHKDEIQYHISFLSKSFKELLEQKPNNIFWDEFKKSDLGNISIIKHGLVSQSIIGKQNKDKHKNKIYTEFKELLYPPKNTIKFNVFTHFFSDREYIKNKLKDKDKEKLKEVILQTLGNISIENFNYNAWLVLALAVGIELELQNEFLPFREKMVKYFVFASKYNGAVKEINEIEFLLKFLDGLNDKDITILIDYCNELIDNGMVAHITNFIEYIGYSRLIKFTAFLEKLLQKKLSEKENFIQEEAFDTLYRKLKHSNSELLNVIYNDISEKYPVFLKVEVQKYLIEVLHDKTAFNDKIKEIKDTKKKFKKEISFDKMHHSSYEKIDILLFEKIGKNVFEKEMLDLLEEALISLKEDVEYEDYSKFLQDIIKKYYLGIVDKRESDLKKIRNVLNKDTYKNVAYNFKELLKEMELGYSKELGKPSNILSCINKYTELKKKQYLPIYDSKDLKSTIRDIIEELKESIELEQLYKVITDEKMSPTGETIIQKTLKSQLELIMHKRGFRGIDIYREVEIYSGEEIDFVIKYGFISPVFIEIKLLHNTEISRPSKRSQYKEKLKSYLAGIKAEYGFYVIFRVKEESMESKKKWFTDTQSLYSDMENIEVILIDCIDL